MFMVEIHMYMATLSLLHMYCLITNTFKHQLLQDVVARPSSAASPECRLSASDRTDGRTGSSSSLTSSLRSSLRSSIRSFAGLKVSNVDDGRTTPDGASLGGGEGEEEEENNAIFV